MRAVVRTRSDGLTAIFRGVAGNIGLRHDLCIGSYVHLSL